KANFKPRIVSTHHGASYRKGKIRLYEEFYVRFILPGFDLTLAVCEADLKSIVKRGVPAKKVKLHLNGTDRRRIPLAERPAIQNQIRKEWKKINPALPDSS